MDKCNHSAKKNFAVSRHSIQHEFCPNCGWHNFNGKEYTEKEWFEAFVFEPKKEAIS